MEVIRVVTDGVSQNKILLVEKTSFLPFANRMIELSLDKPSELTTKSVVHLLQQLTSLCESAI